MIIEEGEFTEAEIKDIVTDALPGNQQMLEEELSDCLIEFLPNGTPITSTP